MKQSISLVRKLGTRQLDRCEALDAASGTAPISDSLDTNEAEFEEMSREEALSFLRTCVNSVLGREGDFAPVEFVRFRSELENRTFKAQDVEVGTLKAAPYFFKKTT